MPYKYKAPLHTYESLELIMNHTFNQLSKAESVIEKKLMDKGVIFTKKNNTYLNQSGGILMEIIKA